MQSQFSGSKVVNRDADKQGGANTAIWDRAREDGTEVYNEEKAIYTQSVFWD